jgi:peptidoglycan LD-endopeptidase LytH
MASLARPAALAALALALAPAAAPADTAHIVFPVAGRVTSLRDDYGALRGSSREQGNTIGVVAGTPVVAAAAGRVQLLWHGSGGWSVTLTTAQGDQFVYLHLGRDGNRKSAFAPGLRTGARVRVAQKLGWSGYSGNATAKAPQLGFLYRPGGGEPVDPYVLLAGATRVNPAGGAAPVTPGQLRLTGVLTWSALGDKAALLRVRTASIVSGGSTQRVQRELMLSLAKGAGIARASGVSGGTALVPGLRVTVWATALKGGALVAHRVRIEG